MDDPEKAAVTISRLVEQLHSKKSSASEKELSTARLLSLAKGKNECRKIIGQNAQAMPSFISLLRSGTLLTKLNVASILSVLCKDENLRSKVLIGGCIPPLLSLLKSESIDTRKAAASAIYEVSLCGIREDNVGNKIFVTEKVVPNLWDQLKKKRKQDTNVEGYVIGALRNLCSDKDRFWTLALEDGGVDIILGLLQSKNPASQSNAASLLARLIRPSSGSISRMIQSGVIEVLLRLLGEENDVYVRASVIEAIEAITSESEEARKVIRDSDGIRLLIGAVVSEPKGSLEEEIGHNIQWHATHSLANLCGGMSVLIMYLGQLSLSPRLAEPVADILGALAYALKIFKLNSETESFDPTEIENILVKLLKPRDTKLIQERILEAMASLYENPVISEKMIDSDAKRVLVGLTILATGDTREHLITCVSNLCKNGDVWEAIGKRDGIQMLIPFMGLSSEHHQEYSVELLAILTDKFNESRWAVTSAGGIPPLVQILKDGVSHKARDDAVCVLWNLCCHSEEIRVCVEKAGAVSAFLWVLKNGGSKSQETSAKALIKLVTKPDRSVIEQVLALFMGDIPKSKIHVTKVLGHVLTSASLEDFVQKGSAANNGLRSLVQTLASSNDKMKENAASVLADLFNSRKDLCNSLGIDENEDLGTKLSTGNIHSVATHLARALGSLSNPTKKKPPRKKPFPPEGEVIKPLIKTSKTTSVPVETPSSSSENHIPNLANIKVPSEASLPEEDVVSILTRVLREGNLSNKRNASHVLHQLLKHFQAGDVFKGNDQYRFAVPGLFDLLNTTDVNNNAFLELLEVISVLFKAKYTANMSNNPFSDFTEVPSSLDSLVRCIAEGHQLVQDKAIEILSRFCKTQHVLLGELLVTRSKSICSLANRITNSTNAEIRVGGAALLVCATKNDKKLTVEVLDLSRHLKSLLCMLLDMTKQNSRCLSYTIEVQRPRSYIPRSSRKSINDSDMSDPVTLSGSTLAMWLLSIICSTHTKNRLAVIEAGGLEILSEKLKRYTSTNTHEVEETEELWITVSCIAVMFHEPIVSSSPATSRLVPSLARSIKSDHMIERYFSAQALAVLVRNKDNKINHEIWNSYIIEGLINSIGYAESDTKVFVTLAEELSLPRNPFEAVLEELLEDEVIRNGSISEKYVPLLVDLLKPIADRSDAPPVAVRLLTRVANGSGVNKLLMTKVGALDSLAKYLSSGSQDSSTEFIVSELLGSLFRNVDVAQHGSAISSMKQLIAILHHGSKSARYNAARALRELFDNKHIKDSESAWKAFPYLIRMLNTSLEAEKDVALTALVNLTSGKFPKSNIMNGIEENPLENVCNILSSDDSSFESKTKAAKLCYVIFCNEGFRGSSKAVDCMPHLISLVRSGRSAAVEAALVAMDRLLDEKNSEIAEDYELGKICIGLVSDENYKISEAAVSCLVKLVKDKTPKKLDLVRSGIFERCLDQLARSPPSSLCSVIAELFRVLTNVGAVARSEGAIKLVQPLLSVFIRDLSVEGQLGGLQAIANILEKPNVLDSLAMESVNIVTHLIPLLQSESLAVQQAAAELLTRLLAERRFQEDIMTMEFIPPLVKLAGIRIRNLQDIAIKGLENSSIICPKEVEEAGGIVEISKIIIDDDPQLPVSLWESAGYVLCNILRSNPELYFFSVTLMALARMLFSTVESTVIISLNALIIREKHEASSVITMAEAGAIDAVLDLLRSHHCEELSGTLLRSILSNPKVREMRICKFAITPLSEYIIDPQTTSEMAKLLVAMALGDLSQHEGLARATDSAFACRALITLLEDRPSQEMQMVAICALQNFVMHSRTNRRAVAEAGGVMLVQELLLSCNGEVSAQSAIMIRCLFSNHTLQDYMSHDLVKSLTAALERELWKTTTVNAEVVRTLNAILTTFPKLRSSEAATMSIPHLISALKSGDKEARESALDTLYTLRQSWPSMMPETARSQAILAADAIPVLQMMMKSRPPGSFNQRGNSLLNYLPGKLIVSIKSGDNLKRSMGSTNAFCRLMIENCPTKQTKVVKGNISPVWDESFTWDFAVPPSGRYLNVVCKTKNMFSSRTLGKVMIPIDKVLTEGTFSGTFSLGQDSNKDNSRRTLDIEVAWSNQMF